MDRMPRGVRAFHFTFFCVNVNINNEGREVLNLDVPRFGEGHAVVCVGGRSGLGRKVLGCGWIVRIQKGCAGG